MPEDVEERGLQHQLSAGQMAMVAVGAVVGLALLVALGPVLLVVALLSLPLLLLGGVAWAAVHALA